MDTSKVTDEELMHKLRAHPGIRDRLVSLLGVVEDADGDLKLADDAELRLRQEIRRMGQELMQVWAEGQVQATEQAQRRGGRAHREGKKNCAGTPPSATSA